MDEGDGAVAARMLREAVAWMASLGSPDYTERTQVAFMAWIKADPRHECAFREASRAGMPGGQRGEGPAPGTKPEVTGSSDPVEFDARSIAKEDGVYPESGGDLADDAQHGRLVCEICGHPLVGRGDDLCGDAGSARRALAADPGIRLSARAWVERLAAGVSPGYYADLRAWLSADTRHGAAYARALAEGGSEGG